MDKTIIVPESRVITGLSTVRNKKLECVMSPAMLLPYFSDYQPICGIIFLNITTLLQPLHTVRVELVPCIVLIQCAIHTQVYAKRHRLKAGL